MKLEEKEFSLRSNNNQTLLNLVNGAFHIKGLLGFVVVFSIKNFSKSLDGLVNRNIFTRDGRKVFGHKHWLGQEPLDLASAGDHDLVFVRQFFDTQNSNNVLQILVALKYSLYTSSYFIVFFTNN